MPIKRKNDLEEFKPGYLCPVCELPIQPDPTKARSRIWHEECKPGKKDPRRRERICPGCGKRHILPERHAIGQPSAFCPNTIAECKQRYRTHMIEAQHAT